MTKNMKKLLVGFANGTDVNTYAQVTQLLGNKREAHSAARTILALLRAGMLQHAKTGGLEISDKGRAAASKEAP